MQTQAPKTTGLLLRLRKQDTPTGVSAATVDRLMDVTGLSKTDVVHLALREMALRYLPHYDRDDGALTLAQIQTIRDLSPATATPDESFTERLF